VYGFPSQGITPVTSIGTQAREEGNMKIITENHNRKMRKGGVLLQVLAAFLAAGLLFSCSSKSDSGTTQPVATSAGELVASTEVIVLDAAGLTALVATQGLTGIAVTSGATCYKLIYGTPDVSAKIINASGLVCLPASRAGGRPVISIQHGTIFQDSEAPSSMLTSADAAIGALFAGLGYISVLPDYIGYGDSTAELHPYVHASTLASATVDMNRAARKFLALPNINMTTNGQLFLTGYSEGGYATLATQRLMQQSLATEFRVTASEPGAGPYDMTNTTLAILSSPTLSQPAFAGFFLKAYDSIYNTPSQLTRYFSATYADTVNTHFDGSFSRSQITAALGGAGVPTTTLFNSAFITSYLGTGETALKGHIAENDIYNWAPQAPTRLFHGVEDDTVPYTNTTTAKTKMTANGSLTVTVVDCNAGPGVPTTHTTCGRPFAVDMIAFFKTLATDL
jgi:pimeloyl-ACP methyl ester carboxylesterase